MNKVRHAFKISWHFFVNFSANYIPTGHILHIYDCTISNIAYIYTYIYIYGTYVSKTIEWDN